MADQTGCTGGAPPLPCLLYFVSHFMSHNHIIKKSKMLRDMGQYETRVEAGFMSL